MCGIAGWTGKVPDSESLASGVSRAMMHRGPDQQKWKHFEQVTLIHNRLKIIDISEDAAQPMSNEDDSVWVIFNGEIYNFLELKATLLELGHVFKSKSDTEVILHLYEEHGDKFVEHIHGMFAICLYDEKKKKMFLCRDRFGIKPLFYGFTKDGIAFASELNSLKLIPGLDLEPDPQSIFDYTSLFYIPAPATFYKGIRCLMPGEIMSIDLNGSFSHSLKQYHNWDVDPQTSMKEAEAIRETSERLSDAVSSQLVSDVPIGSMLSGGIDSSLVSYYAQNASNKPVKTFNVQFNSVVYDETWAAVAVSKLIGSEHVTLQISNDTGDYETIMRLIHCAGQPYSDTSLFAANAICHEMRKYVTVALSGDGGDEGFGGYNLYFEALKTYKFIKLPRFMKKSVYYTLQALSPLNSRINNYARAVKYFVDSDEVDMIKNFFVWIKKDEHSKIWKKKPGILPLRRIFEPIWNKYRNLNTSTDDKIVAILTEANIALKLTNDFLFKVDTASMQESLEVRVPFLDEKLFGFALKLPMDLKVRKNTQKFILRRLASQLLPEEVANKPKWGFGIPVDEWVTKEAKDKIYEELITRSNPELESYLEKKIYSQWVQAFVDGTTLRHVSRVGLYQRVIMLLSLNHFLKNSASPAQS